MTGTYINITFMSRWVPDHRSQLPEECMAYWGVKDQLSLDDELTVYGCRLLISV